MTSSDRVVAHRFDAIDAVAERDLRDRAAAQTCNDDAAVRTSRRAPAGAGAIEKVAADKAVLERVGVAGRARQFAIAATGEHVGAVAELA